MPVYFQTFSIESVLAKDKKYMIVPVYDNRQGCIKYDI